MRKIYFPLFFLLFLVNFSAFAKNSCSSLLFEATAWVPSATISGTTEVCQGSGPQQITFTGSGGTAPYTFTYKINNGTTNHTVTTTSGNSVTINVSSNNAGIFEYSLVSVIDSATDATQETATGSATITINALPVITGDNALCVGTTTDLDGSGQQAPNPAWSSSNPAVATVNNAGVVDAQAPGTTTITYTNSNGCQETKVITVHALPVANFTFDNNNSCSGTNVGFTPSVTGGQGPYTYSWIFGDGNTSVSASPSHKFTSYGCATEVFQVILTVTDANGCIDTVSKNITVKQKPHAALEDQNIFSPFSNCENNPSLENPEFTITVNNVSTDPACTTSYTLNWGDGNVQSGLSLASFPLTHTYTQLGVFNLTLTAIGTNGCNNTVVYPVANQSNPAGSLGTLGSTTGLCAPATVPFTIGNWELNSPGTTYILNFGDGSSVTLQHPLTSSTVYHTYETSSCPNPSYTATLMVVNLCDETPYTAGNIQVRIKPYVAFTGPEAACVSQEVCFVNETVVGSTGSTCNNLTAYQWNFGDPTSPTNTVNVNTAGTPQGCHTFSGPGTYIVTLSATNPCGTHSYSQEICIEAPLSAPSFTLSSTTGCAPFAATATNTSNVSGSCDPIYQWSVINYNATNCGTAPANNYNYFTNGTTASSENPSFNFPNAGTYTIRLRVTNSCGTVTTTQNVIVKQPPTVNINPIADLCGADQVTFTPQLTVTNCGSDPLTYLWSFPDGTPSTSTDPQPSVIYTTPGSHTFSVEVTNECGSTSDSETFSISPTVIADAGDDITICNGTSTQLNGQASGGVPGYTYQWSPTQGLSSPSIANPVASPTVTTTYTLTVRDSQNCPKTSQVTVYVNTINQGSIGNGQTICSGGDPVAFTSGAASGTGTITYQWEVSTTGATGTYTDIPGATDAIYDSPPLTENTWFRRKVISTLNGLECIKTTNFVEIIINDVEPGEVSADQQICPGGIPVAFNQVTAASGTGTLTYQWQSSTDNSNWNNISSSPNPTYSSGPLTQTTYFRRRVTSSLNNVFCTEYSNVVTVTVVPDPVVDVQPLPTQTVCLGAPVSELTVTASGGIGTYSYQWYSNSTNSTTGGMPVSGQVNDNFTPVPSVAGTYYYYVVVTATGPGCSVTSNIAKVIVMPAPTITTQPVSSSVCVGGTPGLLNVSYANGIGTPAYQWYSNTTNSTVGGTAIPSATGTSYQPSATAAGTTYYYAELTFASGGCNAIVSNVATVEVNPAPSITTQPEPVQEICVGGSSVALSVAYTGGSGMASYQWYSNATASNSGGTLIPSATSATYTPPVFAIPGTYYYYVVVTLSAGGCDPVASEVAQVNVVADPVVDTQPLATQTACQNGTPLDLEVTASGGVGALSYQWYSNATNSNTGGTLLPGQTASVYEPSTATLGTVYYYAVITAQGSGCSVTSAVAGVITVEAPYVTTQPASGSVCLGGTPVLLNVAYANGTGTPSYQWFSNATNSNSGGTAIATATSASYQPMADAVGTSYYYAEITFSSGGCSLITSNAAMVEVVPMPAITTQPTALQEICAGGSVPAFTVASSGGTGSVSYQWYSNSTDTNSGGTIIPSATSATYTPPVFATVGTYYYYAVITISGSGCGTLSSEVAQVNVVADPIVDAQPLATQTLCEGSTPAVLSVAVSGGSGTPQYQWYSNTVNNTTTGTMLTGQTNSTYTPSTATVGTIYYYVVVTTPVSGCSVTSSTAAVVVIESPVFTAQPQDETLCHGENPAQLSVAYANGTGTASYQWYSNTVDNADTGAATLISGAQSATYQPSGADAGILYYFATISFTSGGCLVITSDTARITINELPQITSPQATELCNNEAISFAPADGGGNTIPPGTKYTWTLPTGTGFTGATAQAVPQNDVMQTLTNTTNASVTATYTVTPVFNGCPGTAFTLEVTVKPEPQIPAITQTICSGQAFTINPETVAGAIVPAGITYSWSAPTVTGGITGGTAGTGETSIGGTLMNPTNTAQTATYTVNIVSPDGVCLGDAFVITITVNPKPYIDASQTVTICSGASFSVIPTDGGGNNIPANTTYTWTTPVINPAGSITGGTAQNSPQTAISQALNNTTSDVATATYTVTPTSGNCAGETFEIIVTVNPVPTVDDIAAQTLCGGSPTDAITFTGATGGTVYSWTNNTASIGLATSGVGNIPPFIAVNSGTAPVTATITVTPVYAGCPGAAKTFTITVNPAPTVSFSQASQSICSGTASTSVTLSSATVGASISWTAVQPAGLTGVATSGTNTIPAQTLANTTSSPITVTYTAVAATSDASACPGPLAIYTIVVNPVPFVGTPIAEAICSGGTVTVTPPDGGSNNIPAGTTFTWTAPTGTGFTGATAQPAPQPSFSQTLVNTTVSPVTATYMVTPSANGCTGVPFQITVIVNPTAVIGNAAQTICTGGTFSVNPAGNASLLPAGTVYNWNAPTVTGGITGGAAGNGQTLVGGTLVNPSGVMQTATYVVTPVSPDGNCAGAPFNVVVTVSPAFTVTSVVSDYNGFEISVAGGTDGSIDITPAGGSGTYTYNWSGPGGFAATTQDISNLGQGNYTVTISDGLCADVVLQFQMVEPLPLVIAEVAGSHVNVNCFGESTGVIEVEITEVSVGPFDYAILLPNGSIIEEVLNIMAENYVFDNLPAGTYNIRVTDANGTIKFINGVAITQPVAPLAISNAVVSDFNGFSISCNGANNGSIDLTVAGGTPAYNYLWAGPNGFAATTQDINSLPPGNYTVTITDATGLCTVTQTYTITEPLPLALSSVVSDFNGFEIACFGGTSGSINVTPSGGTGTYSYQWTGPNGFVATTQDVANLAVGTYTLTMKDSNNCALAVQTYTLNQPAAITVTETHVNVLCFGAATGSIDITVTGGVTSVSGGYSFAWTGPNSFLATTEDLNNIGAGTYNLAITDDSGCTRTLVVVVTQQPEIIITPATTPISCYGANDATITLNITGGDAPYVAEWNNLAVGTFQDNLAAGNYVITVTDDSGCQKQITVVINEAPIFTVNPVVTQITCNGANDGSIALNLVGGQAPVTMTWSDGSTAGTTRNNLGPGTYIATIFDGTPCQIVRTFTIVEPLALNIGANVTHATVCDDAQSGAINLHPAGGVPPYTFAWSNGASTEDLTGLTSGNYAVTVTDANGCSKTLQYAVTRPDALSLTVNQNVQFNCDAHTVTQTNIAQASGGVPPFNYTWSAGTVSAGNGQMMTTNVNGTYIVTATDAMGCTTNFTFEVNTQQLGEADFYIESYAHTTFDVYSIFDPIQFTNTSTGDYTGVSWNFGDGSVSDEENPKHTYVREGVYTVVQTVTYPYGCVDKKVMVINVGKGYDVMIPNAFTPNADGTNDTFAAVFKGLKSIELAVYDTWGSMIYYEKGDVIQGWNGMIKGVPAENGNYVYRITAETFYGQLVNYEGPFALIK